MKTLYIRYRLLGILLAITVLHKLDAQTPAQILPDFEFSQSDKTIFSNKDLPSKKMSFFVFFDVDCDHCQRAAKNIEQQYQGFQKTAIYIISQDDVEKMNQFMTIYAPKLKAKKNVMLLQDKSNQFLTKFKPYRYPAMFLYSADKKLLDYEDNEESVFRFVNTIKKQSTKN